jgi:phosphoribosylformimino-5-aminoimidazole carboxamide ribotide isomerase
MTDWLRSRLLPVLDLKGGHVVRGVGGRRDEYRPIVSKWIRSSDPLEVAKALRDQFLFKRFYVADLDAICKSAPHRRELGSLIDDGFELDLDTGVHSASGCGAVLEFPGVRAVVGLESLETPSTLQQIVRRFPASRLVFSIDLKNGTSLGTDRWPGSPIEIASLVLGLGIQNLIVLDLAAVGEGMGCPTLDLCREIRTRWPGVELMTGGGVRNEDDVRLAADSGVDRVLVASALHDGRIV